MMARSSGDSAQLVTRNFTLHEKVLVPLKQTKDNELWFARKSDKHAQIRIFNIHPLTITDITTSARSEIPPKKPKSSSVVKFRNATKEPQNFSMSKEFNYSDSRENSLQLGFEQSIKVTFGGEAASVKAEIESKFSQQTTDTTSHTTGGSSSSEFPVTAPEWTAIEGRMTWEEVTFRERIVGRGTWDFGIELGKRESDDWSGRISFPTLGDLIQTVGGNGSVKFGGRRHFQEHPCKPALLEAIKKYPSTPYDQTSEYKGADSVDLDFKTIEEIEHLSLTSNINDDIKKAIIEDVDRWVYYMTKSR